MRWLAVAWVSLGLAAAPALAGDCTRTGSVCIDATPAKTISGVTVNVSQVGGCWEYRDTYTCLRPDAVNYCQPFADLQPQCWQTNSQCAQQDTLLNSGCMRYTQAWRCSSSALTTPANTIRLNESYTLVSSDYDPGPCQSLSANTHCQVAESQCTSTTPATPLPAGITAEQAAPDGCFEQRETYACLSGQATSTECSGYSADPACSLQSSQCDDNETLNGQCLSETRTYQCQTRTQETRQVTDCSGQAFCQNGDCFDRSYSNDTDFGNAMALMEGAREAGLYMDPDSLEIFKGTASRCTIKFGLVDCCRRSSAGGGMSNAALGIGAAVQAGRFFGSPYVYDAMFASDIPWLMDRAVDAWNATAWTTTTSFYGLSFSFSSAAGLQFIGFDPYSFALQVAIMIVQELLSCEQPEQLLSMRRGQDLCVDLGSYCSNQVHIGPLRWCIEQKRSYCCYNSRLAKLINEQGRAQIGKSWGDAQNPNCSGFTQAEFAAIDFSRIDLSEFTAEIMANVRLPDLGTASQQIQTTVQQRVQNYYQR